MIREAAKHNARIVYTTECFVDGYAIYDKSIPLKTDRALGEPIPEGEYFKKPAALADELNIHLVAGMLEAEGGLATTRRWLSVQMASSSASIASRGWDTRGCGTRPGRSRSSSPRPTVAWAR